MSYTTIRFDVATDVASLILHRPAQGNRFTALMYKEIHDALRQLHGDGARALLIGAAGEAFCAGQDLSDVGASHSEIPDLGVVVEQGVNPLIRALNNLEIPVVCAVNGEAAGAGVGLALACDVVLAARSARFVQDCCTFGLAPDAGSSWLLPRLVGQARATALCLLGEAIDAEQAERWGLIWKCVDDDRLTVEAHTVARRLAGRPTKALALTKRALHMAGTRNLDEQLDIERDLQRQAGRSKEFREALDARLEKCKQHAGSNKSAARKSLY